MSAKTYVSMKKKKRTIFPDRDVSRVESCSMFSNDTPDILLHL